MKDGGPGAAAGPGSPESPMLVQALAEYGALQAMASAVAQAWQRAESYVGQGNLKYILGGACVLFLLLVVRRRRL